MVAPQMPFDTNDLPGEGDVTVAVQFNARELMVPAGARIEFQM